MTSPPPASPSPEPQSLVLGVLGGIASGKSAVARLLAGPEGVVIDADQLAREVLETAPVPAQVARELGADLLRPDGALDRAQLARRVFDDPAARRKLESLTHPRVRARVRGLLDEARARGAPRIVLDVPLLLENDGQHGLVAECDALVFVDADVRAREARAQASRGWAPGEVARREAAQMPLETKRERADHVLRNAGGLAELERACARLRAQIETARAPKNTP